jgi:hypothetical protein
VNEGSNKKAPAREPFQFRSIALAGTIGLAIIYLLQSATPLRLDDDSFDYLRVAAAITDGVRPPTLPIPVGYSVILSLLERAGLGMSVFFVLANCVFLAIGLYAVWRLEEYPKEARQIAIVITLLAIPVIKSVTMALPEAMFFGTSLFALWTMSIGARHEGWSRLWRIVLALAFTLVATSIRSVGIALFPALLWSFMHQATPAADRPKGRKQRVAIIAAAIVLTVGFVAIVTSSRVVRIYLTQARNYYIEGELLTAVFHRAIMALTTCGQIFVNLPFSRAWRETQPLFAIAGAASAVGVLALIRKPVRMTAARVYLIGYVALLLVWPNPTSRLWMPIIPLLSVEIATAITRVSRPRWLTVAMGTYTIWFAVTGIAALAYTTRISLSGERFPQVYGSSGGMADPTIREGDKSWPRVQLYRQEAPKLLARYGNRW